MKGYPVHGYENKVVSFSNVSNDIQELRNRSTIRKAEIDKQKFSLYNDNTVHWSLSKDSRVFSSVKDSHKKITIPGLEPLTKRDLDSPDKCLHQLILLNNQKQPRYIRILEHFPLYIAYTALIDFLKDSVKAPMKHY